MKLVLGLMITFSSIFAFAGPEEHKQNQTCYRLDEAHLADVAKKKNFPIEICMEEMTLNPETGAVSAVSYFQPTYFLHMRTTHRIRSDRNGYYFTAANTIYSTLAFSCDDGEYGDMTIEGTTDLNGKADLRSLQVSLTLYSSRDFCHSLVDQVTYRYNLN